MMSPPPLSSKSSSRRPANTFLAGISAFGAVLCFSAAAATFAAGPRSTVVDAHVFLRFVLLSFLACGAGLLFAPARLLAMNFRVPNPIDKYLTFSARFAGFYHFLLAYVLYIAPIQVSFPLAAVWAGGVALLGPTYAALELEPIQTLAGHLPAHVLVVVWGVLSVLGA